MSRHPIGRAGINLLHLAGLLGAATYDVVPAEDGPDSDVPWLRFLAADGTEISLDNKLVQQALADYRPPPAEDPDAELVAAITAATTLAQLKDALVGKGRPSAVAGRPTGR